MTDVSWLGPPIDVRPLLVKPQRALGAKEWDIAAHVLGDHIGRLSGHRDGYCHCTLERARLSPPSSTAS